MNQLKSAKRPEMYTRRRLNTLYREAGLKDNAFRTLRKYFCAMANLYGIITLGKAYEIIASQSPRLVTKDEFLAFTDIARHECENYYLLDQEEIGVGAQGDVMTREIIVRDVLDAGLSVYEELKADQAGKPWYVPKRAALLAYEDPDFYEETQASDALIQFLIKDLALPLSDAGKVFHEILVHTRSGDTSQKALLQHLMRMGLRFRVESDMFGLVEHCVAFQNNSRLQANRGFTPLDILTRQGLDAADLLETSEGKAHAHDKGSFQPVPAGKHKVGRNDPCPCGSGKKYKKCCGK